jgi:N-formylglutamate amidohydrolase
VKKLIEKHYRPYHDQLHALASGAVRLGIDCHTMAAYGPPVGPDAGRKRPHLCLSDADGTLPQKWFQELAECLESSFGFPPSLDDPFKGGFIIRSHSIEIPWVQLEVSRAPFLPMQEKRRSVLEAFRCFCARTG